MELTWWVILHKDELFHTMRLMYSIYYTNTYMALLSTEDYYSVALAADVLCSLHHSSRFLADLNKYGQTIFLKKSVHLVPGLPLFLFPMHGSFVLYICAHHLLVCLIKWSLHLQFLLWVNFSLFSIFDIPLHIHSVPGNLVHEGVASYWLRTVLTIRV